MSRARQVANFDPALFAADEVSGDKVSGGTIGAGVIGASVTGGAGLSGSTSLGTVTAGNLSNTAIVYPVGHIIQTVSFEFHSADSGTLVGSNALTRVVTGSTYNWKGNISNVGASNYVLVTMTFMSQSYSSTNFTGGGWGMFRDTDGAGTSLTEISTAQGSSQYIDAGGVPDTNFTNQITLTYMDKSPATGDNHYYLGYACSASSTIKCESRSTYPKYICTLQEIQT